MFRSRKRWAGTTTARQRNLQVEHLEQRATPAGLFATASAPGTPAVVTVFDSATWQQQSTISPFESTFTGGVNLAVADVNGDGTPDIIVGAGQGGSPIVKVYSGTDNSLIQTFTIGDPNSRAGVTVAAGTFEGSSKPADIVVGAVRDNQALVQVMRVSDGAVLQEYSPFAITGGASVAAADVNGDGTPDVIVGAGPGGAPRVTVFDGLTQNQIFDQYVFEQSFTGGVWVAGGNVEGTGNADVITAAGNLGGPRVQVYSGATGAVTQNFFAYDATQRAGVQAAVFDAGRTGSVAIVTNDGPGQSGGVAAFDAKTLAPVSAAGLPGLPAGVSTAPAGTPLPTTPPTSPPPTSPPTTTDDSGMSSTIPDLTSSNWQTQADGLKIWDVQTGSGTAATATSTVQVFYTGWLTNGTVFDQHRSPNSPASFDLNGGVIQGFTEGITGMQPGGIRNIFIPAALGYGAAGNGTVPPNADLVFQVKLISTT